MTSKLEDLGRRSARRAHRPPVAPADFSRLDSSTQPPKEARALLLVDIQRDFLPPSGSLAIDRGDEILPVVYDLLDKGTWDVVVASLVSGLFDLVKPVPR